MPHDLRVLRRQHAMTLAEAAAGILHPVSLCKIENGQCEPRAETLRKLAARYHTTTADIWDRWRTARKHWLAKQADSYRQMHIDFKAEAAADAALDALRDLSAVADECGAPAAAAVAVEGASEPAARSAAARTPTPARPPASVPA